MLGLPKSTEFNKRIPKQKFYDNLDVSPALKRIFIDQVKVIYWRNKIASTTMNLAEGTDVKEIEIFEIRLNSPELSEQLLRQIDKEIPYHILFLLNYDDKYQAWIGYKEQAQSGGSAFKVNKYYHTEWLLEDELLLKVDGLNMDAAYENYVRQIAGERLSAAGTQESLKDSVERDEKRAKLQTQVAKLEKQARAEKQPNKKFEMVKRLNEYKKQLEDL
ncbi:Methyl-accepting chemotaxis protein [Lachnospiraceae bacterium TWA4]|nr:Methyl-accepting chemotaxis protein [Lachnospiraceae bacterium TWA4]